MIDNSSINNVKCFFFSHIFLLNFSRTWIIYFIRFFSFLSLRITLISLKKFSNYRVLKNNEKKHFTLIFNHISVAKNTIKQILLKNQILLSKEFLILTNLFLKINIFTFQNFIFIKYCYCKTIPHQRNERKKNNSITPILPIKFSLEAWSSSIPRFLIRSAKCQINVKVSKLQQNANYPWECIRPPGLRIVATPWIPFPFASLHFH